MMFQGLQKGGRLFYIYVDFSVIDNELDNIKRANQKIHEAKIH